MALMRFLKCGRVWGSLKCLRRREKRSLHGGLLLKPSVLLVFDLLMMLMLFVGLVTECDRVKIFGVVIGESEGGSGISIGFTGVIFCFCGRGGII